MLRADTREINGLQTLSSHSTQHGSSFSVLKKPPGVNRRPLTPDDWSLLL
jgi:hypothetical protein